MSNFYPPHFVKYCGMLSWHVIATILFSKGCWVVGFFGFFLKQFYNADKVNPLSL